MASASDSDQAPFLPSSSQPIDMIEGDITSTSNRTNSNELSTLDEPVLETIKRWYSSTMRRKSLWQRSLLYSQVISLLCVVSSAMPSFHVDHKRFYNNGISGDRWLSWRRWQFFFKAVQRNQVLAYNSPKYSHWCWLAPLLLPYVVLIDRFHVNDKPDSSWIRVRRNISSKAT